jgi:pyrroloquinoline quinone biosynthesis protein B
MKVRVLGSCAGGGLPQWNCGGNNSVRARRGDPDVPARTQPGLAVSADGVRWSVLNAGPDLRTQLAAFPALHPKPGTRDVPLDTIVLTSAELDHVLGLLVLREALSFRIVSTRWVRDAILDHNAAWRLLEPIWGAVALDAPLYLDRDRALEARFFPVAAKVPGYLRDIAKPHAETTTGLRITERATGARLALVPGLASLDSATAAELAAAEVRFVDGTFFAGDELRAVKPGAPDAAAMGHAPITGADGTLAALAGMSGRTWYVHMNCTNPVLDAASPERARVRRAGVEIADDGMEIEL